MPPTTKAAVKSAPAPSPDALEVYATVYPEVVAAMAPESVIEGRRITNEDVRDWFLKSATRYNEIKEKNMAEKTIEPASELTPGSWILASPGMILEN